MIVAPQLTLFRAFGWTDNLTMLALLHAALVVPLCTWILKSSFDAVPRRDHRGRARRRLQPPPGAPQHRPAADPPRPRRRRRRRLLLELERVSLLLGAHHPLSLYTGSLGLATLITQLDTPLFVLMAAGVTFSALPILFYLGVQRHILRGLTAGAVKA